MTAPYLEDTLGDCLHIVTCKCGADSEGFHFLDSESINWDCHNCGRFNSYPLEAD